MEIVQAIIIMAHTLHLKVVTEGVEMPQQLDFLSEYGCDYVQGYLFSKPEPLELLQPLLQTLNQRKPASLWPARLNPQLMGINTTGNLFAESPDSSSNVSALPPRWVGER
jgi:predicted signal transduction protein with EAL and GGDEF domain